MIVTNFFNKYIKIQSDFIQQVISNPSDYTSIEISANVNCCVNNCGDLKITTSILPTTNSGWYTDLSQAVALSDQVTDLHFKNIISTSTYNVLLTPINLGYVNSTCAVETCTLQTYSGHFSPLFKSQIDTWFASFGISSNVTVNFLGNVIIISDIPDNFMPDEIIYGADNTEVLFGFGSVSTKAFISNNALYIAPQMFGFINLIDGIYSFTVKTIKASGGGHISESSCAFIDVTIKCKVASLLAGIKNKDDVSTIAHLLHYSLVNGSNCNCNCDDMCLIYQELRNLVVNVNINTEDCGC